MKLSAEHITLLLAGISTMLLAGRLFGELFVKFKQAAVIGEILAGIILGQTVFGNLFPQQFNALFPNIPELRLAYDGLTTVAVILLMLVSGLEIDLRLVIGQSKAAFLTGLFGKIFPFALGFLFAYYLPHLFGKTSDSSLLTFSLFIGTAMSISALPVIARTLMDLNLLRTEIGLVVIASAIFDDTAGWIVFSVILGMISADAASLSFSQTLAALFLFLIIMLFIVRKLFHRLLPFLQQKLSYPGTVLTAIITMSLLSAAYTEYIGIHAVFGAFIAGVIIGDSTHLTEKTRETIHQFVTNIFAPLFFVSIGLRVNFVTHFDLGIVVVVLLIAFAGKLIGCTLGARLGGMPKYDALIVGFGMNSRGAMEIILGILALQYGLIHEPVFVALVIMALVTSITGPPFISYFLKKRQKPSIPALLTPHLVLFSDAENKEDIIFELAALAAKKAGIPAKQIISEVMKREELMPTGIAYHLAIPHARLPIQKPVVAAALHRRGISFEAADGLPAHYIFLLLTPETQNELQLELLAQTARLFYSEELRNALISVKSKEEFVSVLQKHTK